MGPFRIHPTKTHIGFINRMTFAGATFKKRWIDIGFILHYKLESPRFLKIETYGTTSYHYSIRIHKLEDIDEEVRACLREAYQVG
jgi:hypothetical protein